MSLKTLPDGFLDGLPKSISMMTRMDGTPEVYRGAPIEMVLQMAHQMQPGLGANEAMDYFMLMLEEAEGLVFEIPGIEVAEDERAAIFIGALIFAKIAKPVPLA